MAAAGVAAPVAAAVFLLLALAQLAAVVYTCATTGSPFKREVWEGPWMKTTLLDFYLNVVAISLWVCYKERSNVGKILWVAALVCTGSVATHFYLFLQALRLPRNQPLHRMLSREPAFSPLEEDRLRAAMASS
eukprot:jgi/Chlat1/5848/Chrsp4S06366